MKKRMISLALALCLALSLAVPVCAADVSDETTIMPSGPVHNYAPWPENSDDPNWSSKSNSTHQFITANAITIVKNSYPTYPLSSYTSTLKLYSDYPDTSESGQTDDGKFMGHFYDPDTGASWNGVTTPTAKSRLTWWYNNAVSEYRAGRTARAMESLGCALHYAADLSTPHHAAGKIIWFSLHSQFEDHANANQGSYAVTSASADTFSWAKRTSIGDMGHNFAVYAKSIIDLADNRPTFATATQQTLPKAQRNCAAVLYKFLVDVGRLS